MATKTEGWFRKLEGERLEIFLKHGDRKVRAHGPEADMFELVEWFEDKTGVQIQGGWRRPPRSGPYLHPAQQDLEVQIAELESGGPPPADEPLPGGSSLEPLI